jgi:DNA-binding NtrC family response regulator
LFHRLAVGRIELPPLRARKGDVIVLAHHFARQISDEPVNLPAELLARWEDDEWPGNVRQLRNAVARYLALGELSELPEVSSEVASRQEPSWVQEILEADLALADARDQVLHEFERRYVERALRRTGGNVTHAARAAGVGRRHFQYLKARRIKE